MTIQLVNLSTFTAHDGQRGLTVTYIEFRHYFITRHMDGITVAVTAHHADELQNIMDRSRHDAEHGAYNGATPNPVAASAAAYRVIEEVYITPQLAAAQQEVAGTRVSA